MTILSESGSKRAVAAERWEADKKFGEPLYIGEMKNLGKNEKVLLDPYSEALCI